MFSIELSSIMVAIVLLLVRLVLALAFVHEFRLKTKDIKKFAEGHNLPVSMSYFISYAELLAAIAMLFGLLAQWAGIGLVLLMISTIYLNVVKWKSPYWAQRSGWEYDLMILIFALIIVVFGPGDIAIASLI